MQDSQVPEVPSTLENIDTAVFRFVDETLNAHVRTNQGIEKVKVLWFGSERAFQIKNNKDLRDGVEQVYQKMTPSKELFNQKNSMATRL